MKILILGREGNLAQAFAQVLPKGTVFLNRGDADFLRPEMVLEQLATHKPNLVINCSAFTGVDLAETDRDKALQINATTVAKIAEWCAKHGAPLMHFSTDYVFSGQGERPWQESDPTNPQNWYGQTKWLGEQAVRQNCAEHFIFRISWVYSETGVNFVKTMLRLGKEREELKVVADQVGYPTYALAVAGIIVDKVLPRLSGPGQPPAPWGTYHLVGPDVTNWHDFAAFIFHVAKETSVPLKVQRVPPIATTEYKTPAVRPLNSRMSPDKFAKTFGAILPPWQQSLRQCLQNIFSEGNP